MARISESARRLHPRLRVLANGSAPVNAMRAEISATVATAAPLTKRALGTEIADEDLAHLRVDTPVIADELRERTRKRLPRRRRFASQKAPKDAYVNVVVELLRDRNPNDRRALQSTVDSIRKIAARGAQARGEDVAQTGDVLVRRNFVSATIPVSALPLLQSNDGIAFVHPSEPLKLDQPIVDRELREPPEPRSVGDASLRKRHGDGADVIIGIIDVGGFDFAHSDFRDDTGTRFLSIWDQGGDLRPPPSASGRSHFNYGSEITKKLMDAAIKGAGKGKLPATLIERQSQAVEASHGTHVASIAAGKRGVCPKASIAAVIVSIPPAADALEERRRSFSDSSRIVHAVEYLFEIAEREKKPISINISLGTNGGPHDGSTGVSRWLDALLAVPGRSICVAAGNSGQEKAQSEDDIGFVMGRIHSSGRVASAGLSVDLEWTVVGNGIEDMSENELEIWFGAQDRLKIMLKPPGAGSNWITVAPREFVQNRRLASGTTVSIYNELYHPTNGCNYAALYLSPNFQPGNVRGVEAGVWKVRLYGDEIRDGRFDCWIERDDPVRIDVTGERKFFYFPSFFSEASNVDSHSISSLACGHRVIAVANLDDAKQVIHYSSSQGPTRDNRSKPDIAAPGTDIVAAKGFDGDDRAWIGMTGTSMASPYVAGVVGLMLAANRGLTSAQCSGILQRTALPLPGASYEWRNDSGFGAVDAEKAVEEALTFNQRSELREQD